MTGLPPWVFLGGCWGGYYRLCLSGGFCRRQHLLDLAVVAGFTELEWGFVDRWDRVTDRCGLCGCAMLLYGSGVVFKFKVQSDNKSFTLIIDFIAERLHTKTTYQCCLIRLQKRLHDRNNHSLALLHIADPHSQTLTNKMEVLDQKEGGIFCPIQSARCVDCS